jgi:hypothetical protein
MHPHFKPRSHASLANGVKFMDLLNLLSFFNGFESPIGLKLIGLFNLFGLVNIDLFHPASGKTILDMGGLSLFPRSRTHTCFANGMKFIDLLNVTGLFNGYESPNGLTFIGLLNVFGVFKIDLFHSASGKKTIRRGRSKIHFPRPRPLTSPAKGIKFTDLLNVSGRFNGFESPNGLKFIGLLNVFGIFRIDVFHPA